MSVRNKIDVCINAYGKPWQTLCTLKSLMKHSSEHISLKYGELGYRAAILKSKHVEHIGWGRHLKDIRQ